MTVEGGIKFFKADKALAGLGTLITASSNNDVARLAIDGDTSTRWESLLSDDTTTETLEITFPGATITDRLLLVGLNFKEFDIMYDAGAGYTDFSNVQGLDGALASISETVFSETSAYYSFDSVSVLSIRVRAIKTQTPNDEKYLGSFIATEELGTLLGFPVVGGLKFNNNARVFKSLSHKVNSIKSSETVAFGLSYELVPDQDDVDLLASLHERTDSFLVWLCGGLRGSDSFRYPVKGFRLQDVYNMQTLGDFSPKLIEGIYTIPIGLSMSFGESV